MKSTNSIKRFRNGRAASVAQVTVLSIAWLAQPEAAAGIVGIDEPAPTPSWTADLSNMLQGEPVTTVTFSTNLDAFGAEIVSDSSANEITSEGVWRLQGGVTTLSFDAPLETISFNYRHKKNAAVVLTFFDASGAEIDSLTLDGKTASSGAVLHTAPGTGFSSFSISWARAEGQWFEIGPVLTATPSYVPAPASLAMAGVMLAAFGRRRA